MYDKQLDAFIEIADCGSFSKAAAKMFITPTAVIKQMNHLEENIGVKLFIRTPRGVYLTAAGRNFYQEAKRIIQFSDEAIARTRHFAESESYTIRIGKATLFPYQPLMDIWYAKASKVVQSQFNFTIIPFADDTNTLLELLANLGQDIDVIVGVCSSRQWDTLCSFYRLGSWPITVAVPRSHALAAKQELEVSDLYGEHLMMVRRGDSPAIDAVRNFLEANHPQVLLENGPVYYNLETFNKCEKLGTLMLSIDCWDEVHPSFKSIPVNWEFQFPYGLLCSHEPSPNVVRFLEALNSIREAE